METNVLASASEEASDQAYYERTLNKTHIGVN